MPNDDQTVTDRVTSAVSLHLMVRLCVPVVPPAHPAESLQVTTVEITARRDAQTLLTADSLASGGEY